LLLAVSAPVGWLPEIALAPDHAPEAVQEVASVDDQVSVEDAPLATEVGFAASVTVGSGGGGGAPATVTVAEVLALPPEPVQVRENVLEPVNAPLNSFPEIGLLPDHAPEAVQELAFVEDQASMEDSPLATELGLAARDTIGDGGGGVDPVQLAGSGPAPPQAASASASSGTSSDARIRTMEVPIPLNDARLPLTSHPRRIDRCSHHERGAARHTMAEGGISMGLHSLRIAP